MPRYKVIDCEKIHDGKRYGIGDEMEVSEEIATQLRLEPVAPEQGKKPQPPAHVRNAKEMFKLVGACKTVEELGKLMKDETRPAILSAAAEKKEWLEAKTRDGK